MKLKNAPNMKLQKPNAENAYIIIGSQAWDFAKVHQAERTQDEIALDDVLPQGEKSSPIVLTAEVLENVHQYRIAPKKAYIITIQRANHGEDVSGEIMDKLCLNLAKNTQAKSATASGYDTKGTVETWQKEIADNVFGNPRECFYVYPLAFEEMIKGHPKEQACKILLDKGMLSKGENGYRYLVRIPHRIDLKRNRCYLTFPLVEDDDEA